MADFTLTVGEKTYTFRPEMATVGALRQVKSWYGPELGRYNNFIQAFFEGDPEAALCAVWMARKAAGEPNPPEPNQMDDFALASWIGVGGQPVEPEENPTPGEPPTPDSTGTPTSSETGTSGSSGTSSTSPPKKSKS